MTNPVKIEGQDLTTVAIVSGALASIVTLAAVAGYDATHKGAYIPKTSSSQEVRK
jgi:hypothetical protein